MGIKRLPWLRDRKKTEPEPPLRAPLPLGPLSNGEFFHPDDARKRAIRRLVREHTDTMARRHGCDRREFLASSAGVCATLAAINFVDGCASASENGGGSGRSTFDMGTGGAGGAASPGGFGGSGDPISAGAGMGPFAMPPTATEDPAAAECVVGAPAEGGPELIVDMQSHFIEPTHSPLALLGYAKYLSDIRAQLDWVEFPSDCAATDCYGRGVYADLFFGDSDTTVSVMSGIPYVQCAGSATLGCDLTIVTNEDLDRAKQELGAMFAGGGDRLGGGRRVLSHAMVMPNDRIDVQEAAMEMHAERGVDNWKTYPPWSPIGGGYWLDDEGTGVRMIEKARALDKKIFCIHKGFPLGGLNPLYTDPRDVGPVARRFPDVAFVVFHSAFEHGVSSSGQGVAGIEGPWVEDAELAPDPVAQPAERGVNALIKTLRDHGIAPNGTDGTRVYAELGSTFATLMTRPRELAHVLGKLLKYVGEDRVLWGTDCLWFGSPRPIIEAMRAFDPQSSAALGGMYEAFGYPALTAERKRKIFGLNAAKLQGLSCDPTDYPALAFRGAIDARWGERRYMAFPTPGPRTRREFLALRREEHREKLRWSGYGLGRRKRTDSFSG